MTRKAGWKSFAICGAAVLWLLPAILLSAAAGNSPWLPYSWETTRFITWIGSTVAILLLFTMIGWCLKRHAIGVLINERNRYSLSRLQIVLWTVIIVPSLYIFMINDVYKLPDTGQSGGDGFVFDWQLLVLMGMSVTSFVSTPMILSLKSDSVSSSTVSQAYAGSSTAAGSLNVNTAASEAKISDFVLGEELTNSDTIDIGRIQMLVISLAAVVIYAWLVGTALMHGNGHLGGMPIFNETLLGLVLVSNAGYLTGKFTPTANSRATTADQLAQALRLSQQITDLVSRLEQAISGTAAGTSMAASLGNLLSMARSLAVEAGTLPTPVGSADFDPAAVGRLEGKYSAIASQLSALTQHSGTMNVTDAPPPDSVRAVQQQLIQRGATGISLTGTADAPTMTAINDFLAQRGLKRSDLSPEIYRFFEELRLFLSRA